MPIPYELPESMNLGAFLRGDTIILPIWTAKDRDGVIVNLTGATIHFTAKRNLLDADGAAPGFQISTATGDVAIIDPIAGTYRVIIPPLVTQPLEEPMAFQWDVQVRTTNPYTLTVARGTFSIHLDATRVVG